MIVRLDKFLKVSGIIKRRSVAQKVIELGGVLKDQRTLKSSYEVKVGDVLTIKQRHATIVIRVTKVPTSNVKGEYFELLSQEKE